MTRSRSVSVSVSVSAAAAAAVGLAVCLGVGACAQGAQGAQGTVARCVDYVRFDGPKDLAAHSDLVAHARVEAFAYDEGAMDSTIRARILDVKIGPRLAAGDEVTVHVDSNDCGRFATPSTLASFAPGDDVVLFATGSATGGWRLLTPAQGLVAYGGTVDDSLGG